MLTNNYIDNNEFKRRLGSVRNAVISLTSVRKDKAISINTKKKLLQSLAFSIATYG